jgi:hypothetical protein
LEGITSINFLLCCIFIYCKIFCFRHCCAIKTVGTLVLSPSFLQWTSSSTSHDDTVLTTKKIPAANIKGCMWSVFGRTGYIRVQIKPGSEVKASEWRLDGFPEQVCVEYRSYL